MDYEERKLRQNSIRIFNLKEGADENDTVDFVKGLLREKLGIGESVLKITQAHRSAPVHSRNAGAQPHFLSWDARQQVLKNGHL